MLCLAQDTPVAEPKEYPEPKFSEVVYKKAGGGDLKFHMFEPVMDFPGEDDDRGKRGAVIFFHGGSWNGGGADRFYNQCKYLARRGALAISADYRLAAADQKPTPDDVINAVKDARSAVRYLRKNAKYFGIDPNKIAVGGSSAGGHAALATLFAGGTDEKGDDLSVSPKPNAIALLCPVFAFDFPILQETFGAEGVAALKPVSPEEILKGAAVEKRPPMIWFHGGADASVPYDRAEKFIAAYRKSGGTVSFVGLPDLGHEFYHFGVPLETTTLYIGDFLASRKIGCPAPEGLAPPDFD